MSRRICLDRAEQGGGFTVRILSGVRGDRTRRFADRAEALAFAESQMGRTGMIADTTLLTDEQLEQHRAREVRVRALNDKLEKP